MMTKNHTAGILLLAGICTGPGSAVSADEPTLLLRDIATTTVNGDGVIDFDAAALGEIVYFSAYHPLSGEEPWVSDGTPEGTRILLDVCPGACGSEPLEFTIAGDRLYFSADDGALGREPWISDGTTAGTLPLADTVPGAKIRIQASNGPGYVTMP